jgi:Leucine-rich repeat (LRR) protein
MAKAPLFLATMAVGMCVFVAGLFISCSGGDDGGVDVDDDSYPSQVGDLSIKAVTPNSVTLEWTAPGDVDTVGIAQAYDMRMSKAVITWENWDSATPLGGEPTPGPFGTTQTMLVTGLENDSTYFFALETLGHNGRRSWISNCAEAMCFDDIVVEFADPKLDNVIRHAIGVPSDPIHRSDLLALQLVDANSLDIADLGGMQYCINVRDIFMTGNLVSDIAPLAGLVEMGHLQMANNNISDIDPLAKLVNLEQLILGGNPVSDISAMAGMARLKDVHLAGCQVVDIGPLEGKTEMLILVLSFNSIADISPLAGMTQMTNLDLASNQISNVAALAGLTQLRWLSLQDNQVVDVAPLAGLVNLDYLDLWNNNIADISPLAGLTKLEKLALIGNDISDASALANLTMLKTLYLSFNPISDISALSNLTLLNELQIQSAQVADLTPLQGLPGLTLLVLNGNQIVNIKPLVDNPHIDQGDIVFLWSNPLSTESVDVHIPALRARGVTVHFE